MPSALKKAALIALKLAVAGALIWLIARNADLTAVWTRLAQIDRGAFALGVAAMFGFCLVMALRWRMLSAAAGQPIGGVRSALLYLEALSFNLVLPGSVGGEVVRVWRTTKLFGGLRRNIAVVLAERVANVGTLALVNVGLWSVLLAAGSVEGLLALAGVTALALAAAPGLRTMLRLLAPYRRRRTPREVFRFGWLVRRRFLKPRVLAAFLLYCALAYAMAAGAIAAALAAAGATSPGPGALAAVALAALLGSSIPLSIAGLGFREGAMVAALGWFGVAQDAALAAALLFTAMLLLQAAPGLAIWLSGRNGGRPAPPAPYAAD
ncbi:MAG: lysylphosphatidylglycerol synthase transmembrane domain-containing protein [Marivibrio sp.]|uniref:lysylphosphatidylglycerol synthase transmembrane domain-containing protein n=1 Tax=Marivibrio sp. TaxID=2039719 RepID=UPI0032EADBD8